MRHMCLLLFGKYYGTLKEAGFFWVNPFCTALNPTVRPAAPVVSANGVSRSVSVSMANKKVSVA